jgi:tetratricopeptide (TPR) repeat protein
MLYLYVELRYHRQLNKICPDIPVRFFSAVGDAVRNNGGNAARIGHAMVYTFDRKSAGFAFSASRVLDELRTLLEELRDRIREYLVLVDASTSPLEAEAFKERLQEYASVILPDESILFTSSALALLGSYVTTVPLPDTRLEQYTGPKITEYAIPEQETGDAFVPLVMYTDFIHDPVKMIRDLLATAPDIEIQTLLDEESFIAYQENAAAKEVYSWYRYTEKQPEYRRQAVMAFFSQQLYALSRVSGSPVPVRLVGQNTLPRDYSFLEETLSSVCTVTGPEKPQFLPLDLQSMPRDLLEMAYLIYRVQDYLYYDELPAFFQFLDKDSSFLASLGSWLYSYGVLSDPADFRSIRISFTKKIIERVGEAGAANDQRIAEFLWVKYESGHLMPTLELLGIFTQLGYQVTDSFLIGCFFQSGTPEQAGRECLARFTSDRVREAVKKLAEGENAAAGKDYVHAESCARDVLHTFQREKITYGEYRSFSLLSQVALTKNKGDDAVVYLEYALENAYRTRYSYAILDIGIELACVHFSVGSFDSSLCAAESAERTAKKCFARDRETFLLFIKGRVSFETGDYHTAELMFQAAASLATLCHFTEKAAIARTWYGRVLSHQGRYHAAMQIFDEYSGTVPDATVFWLESAVLSGHRIEKDFPVDPVTVFRTSGSGISGYSRIEDRSINGGAESYTASIAFSVLLLYYQARFGSGDDILECLSELEKIAKAAYTRDDPHAAVYYYLCYELARHVPTVSLSDGTAFLSRGFKYLQTRAKEITDTTLREQFLRNPVWNSRLFRAAQENMLI